VCSAPPSVYCLERRVGLQGEREGAEDVARGEQGNRPPLVEVLQEFFRTGDPDLMDSMLADNVVQHISGMPPEAHSLEGFKQLLPALPQAFPDTLFEVEDLVAEGDKVAFRLVWNATHQGEFFGIPPTGTRAASPRCAERRYQLARCPSGLGPPYERIPEGLRQSGGRWPCYPLATSSAPSRSPCRPTLLARQYTLGGAEHTHKVLLTENSRRVLLGNSDG
jgi:hypothetical protein